MNQSRTTEHDAERDVYQMKVQVKVETTWLFDTRADAHVMPTYVWEQLGEPTLQTTRVTLRGANEQDDLGAMGALHVRGFIRKIKIQFTAVARDARRCLLSGTQNEGIHVHVESTREFPHTTRRRRKSNDVT